LASSYVGYPVHYFGDVVPAELVTDGALEHLDEITRRYGHPTPEDVKKLASNAPTSDRTTLVRPDFRAWYASSWGRPLAEFLIAFGLWVALLAIGLWRDELLVRVAMVLPLTLLSGHLFTLAHDAGHGSFSTSRAVNGVVGRLGLMPSVHVFGLWRFHHDVHHRYTNLCGRDFVWAPLTVSEYRDLPRWRRRLHRAYRHPSGLGLGLHYAIEIWAPRMLWPRKRHEPPQRSRHLADTFVLYGLLIGLAVPAWGLVALVESERTGDVGSWVSALMLLFVFPLIGTHWLIGFVIYLNHTHPDIVWYDDAVEWSRHQVQLEGSAGVRFDPLRHVLLPRRIMNHTVHHLDPGVPLRALASAQQHLVVSRGDQVVSWDWSRRQFSETLTRCKLYDFDAQRWITYPATEDRT
jgi:omega-6 fatty acid desaturase (delta-12 desaturase)